MLWIFSSVNLVGYKPKKNPVAFGNNRVFLTNKIWLCGSGRHIVGMKVLCSTYIRNKCCKANASYLRRKTDQFITFDAKTGQFPKIGETIVLF